jgi:hypothetical protein
VFSAVFYRASIAIRYRKRAYALKKYQPNYRMRKFVRECLYKTKILSEQRPYHKIQRRTRGEPQIRFVG